MNETELVFAENSPYDSLEAVIEQDNDVAYFYLRPTGKQKYDMKSCWIRNFCKAPETFDKERMKQGFAPILPERFCKFPDGQPKLIESELRIVWFESGDGAALMQGDEFLSVIPPWSGTQIGENNLELNGYARDCIGVSPLCVELSDPKAMNQRIANADQYWSSWQTDDSPWLLEEPKLFAAYEKAFGTHSKYYAIDNGQWPPKAIVRFDCDDRIIFITLGVSLCPQPQAELYFENPSSVRRIELGCSFSKDVPESTLNAFLGYLSGQAAMPWQQLTFLAGGHTITCDLFLKTDHLPDFSSILLWNQNQLADSSQVISIPNVLGEEVNLLWTIPLFENERQMASQLGSAAIAGKILKSHGLPLIGNRSIAV